jgi:hypothetical protein
LTILATLGIVVVGQAGLATTNREEQVPFADKEKQRKYHKQYAQKNREKIAKRKREWLDADPDRQARYTEAQRARTKANPEKFRTYFRNYHIKKAYGITAEQYEALLQGQGGACAICGRLPNGTNHVEQSLVIDHCHDTGKVRGLLCNNCNSGMGIIGDSVEHLEAAIEYLKRYSGGENGIQP